MQAPTCTFGRRCALLNEAVQRPRDRVQPVGSARCPRLQRGSRSRSATRDRTHPDPRRPARGGLRALPGQGRSRRDFQVTATVFREGHDTVSATSCCAAPRVEAGPVDADDRSRAGTDRWGADVTPDQRGRWSFHVEAWGDPIGHLAPRRGHQDPRRPGRRADARRGAPCCSSGPRAACPGRRAAADPAGRAVAAARHRAARRGRLAAADGRRVRRHLAHRYPLRDCVTRSDRCRCGSTASGRCTAPGTSSSRAPRAPARRRRPRPRVSGTFAHRAERLPTRSPRWASTSSTCRRSTRSARVNRKGRNNTLTPARTTPARRGRSASPEGGHDAHPPRPRHDGRLRRVRRRRPRDSGWRWRWTSRCRPRPTTRG